MLNKTMSLAALLALSFPVLASDSGAIVGGAVGGAAGAAIGQKIDGKNGAIIGAAIGGATGAAIGAKSDKPQTQVVEKRVIVVEHDDHPGRGKKKGHRKHKHHNHD